MGDERLESCPVPDTLILTHSDWWTDSIIPLPRQKGEVGLGDHLKAIDKNCDGKIVYNGSSTKVSPKADFTAVDSFQNIDPRAHELSNILRGRPFLDRYLENVRKKSQKLPYSDRVHMLDLLADFEGLVQMAEEKIAEGDIEEATMLAYRAKVHIDEWQRPTLAYLKNRERVNRCWNLVTSLLAEQQIEERISLEPRFGATLTQPLTMDVSEVKAGDPFSFPLDIPWEGPGEVMSDDALHRAADWVDHVEIVLRPSQIWPAVSQKEYRLNRESLISDPANNSHLARTTYGAHTLDYNGKKIKIPATPVYFMSFLAKPEKPEALIQEVCSQPHGVQKFDLLIRAGGKEKVLYGVVQVSDLKGKPVVLTRVTDAHLGERMMGQTVEKVIRWSQHPTSPYDSLFVDQERETHRSWSQIDPEAKRWRREFYYDNEYLRRILETGIPSDTTLLLDSGDAIDHVNSTPDLYYRMMAQTNFLHQAILLRDTALATMASNGNHPYHARRYADVFRDGQGIPKSLRQRTDEIYGTMDLFFEGPLDVYPRFDQGSVWANFVKTIDNIFTPDRWDDSDDDVLAESYRFIGRERHFFRSHGPLTIVNLDTNREDFHALAFWGSAPILRDVVNGIKGYLFDFAARGKGLSPPELGFVVEEMMTRASKAEGGKRLERFVVNMHYPLFHRTSPLIGDNDWVQDALADESRRVLISLFWVLREHIQVVIAGHTHSQEEYGFRLIVTKDYSLPKQIVGHLTQQNFELELKRVLFHPYGHQGKTLAEEIKVIWERYGIDADEPVDGNKGMPGDSCPGILATQLAFRSIENLRQDVGVIQITGRSLTQKVPGYDTFRFDAEGRWVGYELRGLSIADDGSTLHQIPLVIP